tara:strand:+ start:887 stop:1378 length:492 start_codon:yes stop_codon:yes gene_type:complete
MALFGSNRDIKTFKGISRELTKNIISQQCGYYKIVLGDTKKNIYGEALDKYYIGPVLLTCMIERGDFSFDQTEFGPDTKRPVTFRFLKDDMVEANVHPEPGDVIMYNEVYYQADNVNENQLIVGKDPDYSYSAGLENFGSSYSITINCHYASPDALGITQQRL